MRTLAYYNGKVVDVAEYVADPKRRFSVAAMRVSDNAKEGYVLEGGRVYRVKNSSRTSVLVKDEGERARVIAEIENLLFSKGGEK